MVGTTALQIIREVSKLWPPEGGAAAKQIHPTPASGVGERFVDETMGGKKKGGQKAR
jgi:hypothetical protein